MPKRNRSRRTRSKSRRSKNTSRRRSRSRSMKGGVRSRCESGEIYRKGYTRKTKNGSTVSVSGKCIRSVSQSRTKRSLADKKYLQNRARSHARARKLTRSRSLNRSTGSRECPSGYIKKTAYSRSRYNRRSYTRSDGTRIRASKVSRSLVPETCIKDRGKPGKGKQLFRLEKGLLRKYGYEGIKNKSENERRRSLKRALADNIEPLPLFRRINALYVLNKNQDPQLANILRKDRDFIKTTNEYKNRETSRPRSRSKSTRSRK